MIPTRVTTDGSVWVLDDDQNRYARMPRHEGPRKSPPGEDWGGSEAGPLEDLQWHDMASWEIREVPVWGWMVSNFHSIARLGEEPEFERAQMGTQEVLIIHHLDDDRIIRAPNPVVETHEYGRS